MARQRTLLEDAANDWKMADASAIKAVHAGTADPDQQRRAMRWILESACGLPNWPFQTGDGDRETNVALGRQLVGHLIMKLVTINLATVKRRPESDPPSEQA